MPLMFRKASCSRRNGSAQSNAESCHGQPFSPQLARKCDDGILIGTVPYGRMDGLRFGDDHQAAVAKGPCQRLGRSDQICPRRRPRQSTGCGKVCSSSAEKNLTGPAYAGGHGQKGRHPGLFAKEAKTPSPRDRRFSPGPLARRPRAMISARSWEKMEIILAQPTQHGPAARGPAHHASAGLPSWGAHRIAHDVNLRYFERREDGDDVHRPCGPRRNPPDHAASRTSPWPRQSRAMSLVSQPGSGSGTSFVFCPGDEPIGAETVGSGTMGSPSPMQS